MKEKELFIHFEFNPKHILFLINEKGDRVQIYVNGKYTWTDDYRGLPYEVDVIKEIRKQIYLDEDFRKGDTKIFYYGEEFDDEDDFDLDLWTLVWQCAEWIRPTFWTPFTTKHGSGLWTKFIWPKVLIDNDEIKLTRWLNFYFTKNRKQDKEK
jgi:hypothetical protein